MKKMTDVTLTIEEQKAIASLKRLAKNWPSSLSLFSHTGSLEVVKDDASGLPCYVASITGIRNDGGDPDEVNQYPDIEYEK
jgi:hypothetical protein